MLLGELTNYKSGVWDTFLLIFNLLSFPSLSSLLLCISLFIKFFVQIETESCAGISPVRAREPADTGRPHQIRQQESPAQLYSQETQGKPQLRSGPAGIVIYNFQTQSKLVSLFEGQTLLETALSSYLIIYQRVASPFLFSLTRTHASFK